MYDPRLNLYVAYLMKIFLWLFCAIGLAVVLNVAILWSLGYRVMKREGGGEYVVTKSGDSRRNCYTNLTTQVVYGSEEVNRYIEVAKKVAVVPKPEGCPDFWYNAIPDFDLCPFERRLGWGSEKRFKLVYADRQYLSFRCEEEIADGGLPWSYPIITVGTIDRRSGKQISLNDVPEFSDRTSLAKRLHDAALKKFYEPTASNMKPHENFYLSQDGWHFVYGYGEVSCLADRCPEIVIDRKGMVRTDEPKDAKLLYEIHKDSEIALFAGETPDDVVVNKKNKKEHEMWEYRNSLFMRRINEKGEDVWLLLMTSADDWKCADDMLECYQGSANDVRSSLYVLKASLSKDGRYVWLVCDPHIGTYYVVCRYDLYERTLRVISDGDSAEEQEDGTMLIRGRKTYLNDGNGEPLGAHWYDAWITPDGKLVRKSKPERPD